jgi:hypothetical protein
MPHRARDTAAIPRLAALANLAMTGDDIRWEETPAETGIEYQG